MFGVALKIVGYPLFLYWLTLSSVISLSLSLWMFDVHVCVLLIYTFFISIICVLWEQPSLISSNKQKYNFCKWIVFEKKLTVESYFF